MATLKPLVIKNGQPQELPAGDVLSAISNVIAYPTTISADTSYVVIEYLDIDSDIDIDGNLEIL